MEMFYWTHVQSNALVPHIVGIDRRLGDSKARADHPRMGHEDVVIYFREVLHHVTKGGGIESLTTKTLFTLGKRVYMVEHNGAACCQ